MAKSPRTRPYAVTSAMLHLRLPPERKARFVAAATADHRTLSDWVRITLEDAAGFAHKETHVKMTTKPITLTNAQRLALFQIVRHVRSTDYAGMRANNLVFREFGLLEIEAAITAATPSAKATGDASSRDAIIERGFAERFDVTGPGGVYDISEAGAAILRGYLDKMGEIFPAGTSVSGVQVPAGLPAELARALAPVVDALDEAWPTDAK